MGLSVISFAMLARSKYCFLLCLLVFSLGTSHVNSQEVKDIEKKNITSVKVCEDVIGCYSNLFNYANRILYYFSRSPHWIDQLTFEPWLMEITQLWCFIEYLIQETSSVPQVAENYIQYTSNIKRFFYLNSSVRILFLDPSLMILNQDILRDPSIAEYFEGTKYNYLLAGADYAFRFYSHTYSSYTVVILYPLALFRHYIVSLSLLSLILLLPFSSLLKYIAGFEWVKRILRIILRIIGKSHKPR